MVSMAASKGAFFARTTVKALCKRSVASSSARPTNTQICRRLTTDTKTHAQSEDFANPAMNMDESTLPSTTSSPGEYISPMQDLFDRMHANGPTVLGTTDEYSKFEKELKAREKKLACGIPESKLRFRTISHGRLLSVPHVMSTEHRIMLIVKTKDLDLTPVEYEILREVVGRRLNDEKKVLRLSSNVFGSRIENKRHVVSMLDRIILSCQRLAEHANQEVDCLSTEEVSSETKELGSELEAIQDGDDGDAEDETRDGGDTKK